EHGFVFRMDLALRPHGNSGPTAMSLSALDNYFQSQGREWERFAWLKSRVVAPSAAITDGSAQALRGSVLPFVFRRYLDYNVFDALRLLHKQIREHAARRSAGHPERANDVKMSRGGIREIEFTVQLLQVVRGGQFPELRTRGTVVALQKLATAGLMPQATANALVQAYNFLRATEHRIQYLDDQQTHVLPTRDDDLHWIAGTLGYPVQAVCATPSKLGSVPAHCPFLNDLDTHRELVAHEFDKLLGGNITCKGCHKTGPSGSPPPAPLEDLLQQPSDKWPMQFRARLVQWHQHPRVLGLRDESRARLSRLVQRTAEWLLAGTVTEQAAIRLMDWIEPLLRRESYLALLLERPAVHARLLRLLGTAKWPAQYLLQHPGVIDELASDELLTSRFDASAFSNELTIRLASLKQTGEDDEETCLNLLRRAHHAEVFRTLARDVEGVLTVEQVADDLSALADTVLRTATGWCWERLKHKHRLDTPESTALPQLAIIAYGKLGGRELGYGSDLDIVFVYDDDEERAGEVYGMLVRKLINWLTVKTAEGDLFEIDTALRPNGNSGMLVTSFEAFANYQLGRGSNTAWTWEHQAMTRARCVYGSPPLQARFEDIRCRVITAPRDAGALQREIVAMRAKVRLAHPIKGGKFDVKHSLGGMVDAEFAVQYLVLLHGRTHPELLVNVGNIALLRGAEAGGLLPSGVGERAVTAYRTLRRVQHQARLNEASTQVNVTELQTECDALRALWNAVLQADIKQSS
ncbi:MAG: bifunctional [glutamate--ammonia ligase]-adenylyl-L-tyrosine phosphorylase/[glutamate--ammonia-ligase] adenylyltransferase, partial [Polaromonas sp.]|nr:bifunctional [glutamate--ammonia ligase]-adenylyl-L-tyrosine phosphorylase/[glutamate--ammonia-ligase] adenylyltransferase [Polaromonas sp.]